MKRVFLLLMLASFLMGSAASAQEDGRLPPLESITVGNAARLEALTVLDGKRQVNDIALSPDGIIAVASGSGLWLYDPAALYVPYQLTEHLTTGVVFSPDGTLLASGENHPGVVRLWDAASHELQATLFTGEALVGKLAFSPKGDCLAVETLIESHYYWNSSGDVQIWDWQARTRRNALKLWDIQPWFVLQDFAFVSGSRLMTFGFRPGYDGSGQVQVWNLDNGALLQDFYGSWGEPLPVQTWAATAHGTALALGGTEAFWENYVGGYTYFDALIRLLDVDAEAPGRDLLIPETDDPDDPIVLSLAFSPDASLLASITLHHMASPWGRYKTSESSTLQLWDTATGEALVALPAIANGSTHLAFSPRGDLLVAVDEEGRLSLWGVPAA